MYLELFYFVCSVVLVFDVFLWVRQRLQRTDNWRPEYTLLSSIVVNDSNVHSNKREKSGNKNDTTVYTNLHNDYESHKCNGSKLQLKKNVESEFSTMNRENKKEYVSSQTDDDHRKTSNIEDAVVTYDYVVIGAGPAGLAASYELLKQTNVSVLLIEKGEDPLPSSRVGQLIESLSPSRLVSLAPECVRIPIHTLPTLPVDLSLKSRLSVIDSGCTVQRPLRELQLYDLEQQWQENIAHTTESKASEHFSVVNNDSNSSSSNSAKLNADTTNTNNKVQCRNSLKTKEVVNCFTPYPRGCGVGGTSLMDWGLELPSFSSDTALEQLMSTTAASATIIIKASFVKNNSRKDINVETLSSSSFSDSVVLPQHQPHPVSVAFCDAVKSVRSQFITTITDRTAKNSEKQKQCKHNNNNNNNKTCNSIHTRDNIVCNLPLRIDGHGRRLPIATSHLFTDKSDFSDTNYANEKESENKQPLSRLHVLHRHKVVDFILTPCTSHEAEQLCSQQLHEESGENTTKHSFSTESSNRFTVSAVIVTASTFHDATFANAKNKINKLTNSNAKCVRVNVRCGVVLAAGVVCTPRLVYRMLSKYKLIDNHCTTKIKDALALPLIVQAHHGISRDACNTNEWKCWMQWLWQEQGPWTLPLTEAMVSVPIPECGPAAILYIFCFAFGGRDVKRFYQMGWDRLLASFTEAVTFLIVIDGIDGLHFPLSLSDDLCEIEKVHAHHTCTKETKTSVQLKGIIPFTISKNKCTNTRTVASAKESTSTPPEMLSAEREVQNDNMLVSSIMCEMRRRGMQLLNNVQSVNAEHSLFIEEATLNKMHVAFARGINLCRQIAKTPPLSLLLTGHEAIDGAILSKTDPQKALELTKLLHLPPNRVNKRVSQRASELMKWANEIAESEPYVNAYIDSHAYWLGFGSGSSAPFVHSTSDSDNNAVNDNKEKKPTSNTKTKVRGDLACLVKGVDNCVIGDTSIIHVNDDDDDDESSVTQHKAMKYALIAGSNNSAIVAGKEAARLLIQHTLQHSANKNDCSE